MFDYVERNQDYGHSVIESYGQRLRDMKFNKKKGLLKQTGTYSIKQVTK